MATIHRLANGVTCVCETRKEPGNVAMRVMIGSGAAHDADYEAGLTNLMLDSCFGGTATRSREEINDTFAALGSGFGSGTETDNSVIEVQGRGRDAAALFDLMADILRNPAFEPAEIAKAQWIIGQQIDQAQQDTDDITRNLFHEALYGQQGASRPILGDKAIVQSLTPAQVRQRHAAFLAHPDRIVVSFAGDIDEAEALRLTSQYFADLKPGPTLTPAPAAFIGGDRRLVTSHEQVNLRLAFPAPNRADMQRYNLTMLQQLLSGGMSSPLHMEIREKRGLVYGVDAGYAPGHDSGAFIIYAGSGADTKELIQATIALIGDIAQKGFTKDQLDTARKSILQGLRSAMEKAKNISVRNASTYMGYGEIPPLEIFEEKLRQVTSEGIQQACATMMATGKYALSAVGPLTSMPTEQEIKDWMAEQVKKIPVFQPHAPSPVASASSAFNAAAKTMTSIAEPQMTILPNGIKVVTIERPGSLADGAWGNAGSDYETEDESGSAHANEHMMFRGTTSYQEGEIPRIVEQELNGHLNAGTNTDRVCYYFYGLPPEALEKTVDICGEMLWEAKIEERDWSGIPVVQPDGSVKIEGSERNAILEEDKMYKDDVGDCLQNQLMQVCYPGQSSGRPVLGTPASLNKIKSADLIAFRDKYYAPSNMVFVAAGPVRHQDFVALIDRKFGHKPAGIVHNLPTPVYHGGLAAREMKTAAMCEIMLAGQSVPANHPDAAAYQIMGAIFGGGPTSRFVKEVVIRQHLSHNAGGGLWHARNRGNFIIGASVQPRDAKKVIGIAYQELRKLAANVTQNELDKIKSQIETSIMLQMETSHGSCSAAGSSTLVYGKPMTSADTLARIRAVTLDDIKRVAKQVLQSDPAASFIVPPGTDRNLLPTHAEIVAMRDGAGGTVPAAKPSLQP